MILLALACSREVVATELMLANPMLEIERVEGVETRTHVEERVEAGSYMYLRTELGWIASLHKPIRVGDVVSVKAIGIATDFHSRRTGRTFSELQFAVVRSL